LSEAKRILEMREEDPAYNKEQFGIIIRAKCSIINSAINASLRVSEEKFRQKRFDKLPELLALIAAEEKRLPAKLIESAIF
jgi:hypothetical protein